MPPPQPAARRWLGGPASDGLLHNETLVRPLLHVTAAPDDRAADVGTSVLLLLFVQIYKRILFILSLFSVRLNTVSGNIFKSNFTRMTGRDTINNVPDIPRNNMPEVRTMKIYV